MLYLPTFTIKHQPNVGTYIPYMDGMGYNWIRPAGLVTLWVKVKVDVSLCLYYSDLFGISLRIDHERFKMLIPKVPKFEKRNMQLFSPFFQMKYLGGGFGIINIRRRNELTYKFSIPQSTCQTCGKIASQGLIPTPELQRRPTDDDHATPQRDRGNDGTSTGPRREDLQKSFTRRVTEVDWRVVTA